MSYSALASPKSVLVFQRLSYLPCVSYYFLVSSMYLPETLRLFAFRGTASSNAGFSLQSEGMTTLTNRSPYVYHCAALRTYLPQAHTCTSVHVPHFITNNEVTPKEFSTKLSLSLLSPCLATQIIHFLPRVIIRARRSIPSHIIRKGNLAYYL